MHGQRICITKLFHRLDIERTGLRLGLALVTEPYPAPDGQVWVKCPEVEVVKNGERVMRSDGYAMLAPNEYEVISEENSIQNHQQKAA